jgi:hypothetical protein
VKKGPGYLLACDVESTIEGDGLAEKFGQQEARGFTNGDLFGSLRLELQNKILERARRKRIYKEGPHALPLSYEEGGNVEEEDDVDCVGSVFCASLGDPNNPQVGVHEKSSMIPKNPIKPYWARACPEIDVQLVGCKGEIRALLDSGSELNLMSKELYEKG